MTRGSVDMNFLFTLGELQRLVRAYADKQAARYGITRAQWAVLAKVERNEGLKQSELAEQMEMQPITLTRLIDRLCDNGWIERRGDETDRRVNRLYLRKAARPLLGKLERAALRTHGDRARRHQAGRRPPPAHPTGNHQGKRAQRHPDIRPANHRERSSAMADPVLKFPPEQKGDPGKPPQESRHRSAPPADGGPAALSPLPAAGRAAAGRASAALAFYLNGGRYVATDDAYVGAQKVLITPDISGKIEKVVVQEGQHVKQGDELFEIDPVPFRLAVDAGQGEARRRRKTTYDNLVANIKIYGQMLDLAQQGVDLKQRDVERKTALVKNNFGSQLDLDNASNALVTARRAGAVHQAADLQRQDAAARQSRPAAGAVPALCAGQGQARPGRSAISTTP